MPPLIRFRFCGIEGDQYSGEPPIGVEAYRKEADIFIQGGLDPLGQVHHAACGQPLFHGIRHSGAFTGLSAQRSVLFRDDLFCLESHDPDQRRIGIGLFLETHKIAQKR